MFNDQTIPFVEMGYKSKREDRNPYPFRTTKYFAWQYGYDKIRLQESIEALSIQFEKLSKNEY